MLPEKEYFKQVVLFLRGWFHFGQRINDFERLPFLRLIDLVRSSSYSSVSSSFKSLIVVAPWPEYVRLALAKQSSWGTLRLSLFSHN